MSEFEHYPILQTGPHCQLYVNKIDFNALLMSWMGSKLRQLKHTFILNSVTRTLQWSKHQGPGWLNLKYGVINLFDLTPKQMSKLSVCSAYPQLTYRADNIKKYLAQADYYEKKGVEKLITSISSEIYEGFIPAFTSSNKNLMKQCDHANLIQPIIMNDQFTSILVAEHLSYKEGLFINLFFLLKNVIN